MFGWLPTFLENTGTYVQTSPWLAVVAVFLGGILTAANPCVLAIIPLMMGFVAGRREDGGGVGVLRSFLYSLLFVLGLSITFTILGATAALAGKMYGGSSKIWNWVVALVCLAMGLHLLELFQVPIPSLGSKVQPRARGALGALLLGLLFGLVSTPCAAPILLVLLAYLSGSKASVGYGAVLLLVYALGHSVLVLVAGTSMGLATRLIESRNLSRVTGYLRKAAGVVIILVGGYFVYKGVST